MTDPTLAPYIFIAGPYTGGDVAANVSAAMAAGHIVRDAGARPYVPHLWHFAHIQSARAYDDWADLDIAWLRRCDALIRLPGESPGADGEVAEAKRLGLPVYIVGENCAHVADAMSRIWPVVR